MKSIHIYLILNFLLLSFSISADNWYVDDILTGTEEGTIENPFHQIYDALDAADEGDSIWIAAGVYSGTLRLKNRIKIYGGYGLHDFLHRKYYI